MKYETIIIGYGETRSGRLIKKVIFQKDMYLNFGMKKKIK